MVGYLDMSSLEGGANEPRLELSLVKKRVTQQQDGGMPGHFCSLDSVPICVCLRHDCGVVLFLLLPSLVIQWPCPVLFCKIAYIQQASLCTPVPASSLQHQGLEDGTSPAPGCQGPFFLLIMKRWK